MRTMIQKFLLCAAFAVTGVSVAQAGHGSSHGYDLDNRLGFGIGGGANLSLAEDYLTDNYDEQFSAAAWFRYHFTSYLGVVLAYDHFQYDDNDAGNGRNVHLNLSLAYTVPATSRSRFIVQAGVGLMKSTNFAGFADSSLDTLGVKARLGYEFMLARDWALGVNADFHWADVSSDDNNDATMADQFLIFSPMIGLTYYFGNGHRAPVDSDGDGITDDLDKCAGTPKGVAVGADGCEVKKVAPVSDSDHDGVPDADDQCPNTKMGKKVNQFGCSAKEKLEFKLDVKFDTGKWVVKDEFKSSLTDFADFMNKYPETKAEIAGHTDSTGKAKYNFTISQKRSDAVKKYLVDNFGIDATRLTAKGYGPSQPVADNGTADGRRQNRRVVANVKVEVE